MSQMDTIENTIIEWLIREPYGDRSEELGTLGVALTTSQGAFRDINQDRVAYVEISRQATAKAPLAAVIVADGIGGMSGGERGASIAVAALSSYLALGDSASGLKSLLINAVTYANERVFAALKGRGGTTLSAILYGKQGAIGASVGDSRIYRFNGHAIQQLTLDDTLEEYLKVQRRGKPRAEASPKDDRLVQFIGIGNDLTPHVIDLSPFTAPDKIRYLLSSDGAHFLGEDNLSAIFRRELTSGDILKAIVEASRLLGSTDNASAIICPKMLSLSGDTPQPILKMVTPNRELFALIDFPARSNALRDQPRPVSIQPGLFESNEPGRIKATEVSQRKKTKKKGPKGSRNKNKQKKKRPVSSRFPVLQLLPADSKESQDNDDTAE